MIFNLGSKKGENNSNSTCQLRRLHNLLLMSIVDTPENYLPNVDHKSDMRKVRTSSIKSSSTLFYSSISSMYNRVNFSQKQRFMLNSYVPGINTSILPKRHYDSILSEKLVYELHAWIENHPHVIHSPNSSDSLFVKINGTHYKSCAMIRYYQFIKEVFFMHELLMGNYVLEIRHLRSTYQNI